MWLLTAIGIGAFIAYAVLYDWFQLGDPRHSGDFFALWSYGHILRTHGATALYDPAQLHALQVGLGMAEQDFNPFPYPPAFLLMVWPLGLMPFGLGFVMWTGVTLALFIWACGGRPLALVLPVTTLGIISGQSGFLAGALLLGGFRTLSRPWLAGALLGLLTYKPQLGVLVPVALLALGAWRVIAAACVTALAVAGMATAAFGTAIWAAWLTALPAYAQFFAAKSIRFELMPTVTAGLSMLRVPGMPYWQLAAFTLLAACVWRAYRAGPTPRALLVLTSATVLATPHAFVYDTPMVAGAALLWAASLRAMTWAEFGLVALVLVLPPLMIWSPSVPLGLLLGIVPLALAVERKGVPPYGSAQRLGEDDAEPFTALHDAGR